MSNAQFANNASTTLGSSASSGTTTMTVATGTGSDFPALSGSQYFMATLYAAGSTTGTPNEIVKVTARSGNTMTVVRGQEGTTAVAWAVGDVFANYPTAGFLNGLAAAGDTQQQSGNAANDTGAANAGVITLVPAPANLAAILFTPIRVLKIGSSNTGAYTLNINGFGVKSVRELGATLAAGQLPASQIFEVVWDGTNFQLLSTPARIQNEGLAQMPAVTVKANVTGSAANAADVLLSDLAAALPLLTSVGSTGNQALTIGGLTLCVHDFTITGNTTISVPHGNSHVYASWARCLMAGDDSNSDVSTACVGWNVNHGTIYSNASGFVNCWLFSIGQ
jgi:hypothetical protein